MLLVCIVSNVQSVQARGMEELMRTLKQGSGTKQVSINIFVNIKQLQQPLFLMLIIKVLEWHAKLEELRIRVSKRQTNYWHHPL